MDMNIRICERDGAERMLRNGTFGAFLQMWLDRYPQRDIDFEIGPDCTLRREGGRYTLLIRLKGIWTVYKEDVEPGKVADILRPAREIILQNACDKQELMRAGRTGELYKKAKKLAFWIRSADWRDGNRHLPTTELKHSAWFCGEEIWRRIRKPVKKKYRYKNYEYYYSDYEYYFLIERKDGQEVIETTFDAIYEYMKRYYEKQKELTRGEF